MKDEEKSFDLSIDVDSTFSNTFIKGMRVADFKTKVGFYSRKRFSGYQKVNYTYRLVADYCIRDYKNQKLFFIEYIGDEDEYVYKWKFLGKKFTKLQDVEKAKKYLINKYYKEN